MHYYIDGYNLLFRILKSEKNFPELRQKVIEDLNHMIHELNIDATLVFDAYYRIGEGRRSHYHNLEVQFTSEKVTADEHIIQALKHNHDCTQETVVTSDNKLAWLARRMHAKTESVENFVAFIKKRYKNKNNPEKIAITEKKRARKNQAAHAERPPSSPSSFDYYLQQFEANYQKLEPQKKPVEKETSKKRHRKSKQEETEKVLDDASEMDRWLRLFEKKDSNGHNCIHDK